MADPGKDSGHPHKTEEAKGEISKVRIFNRKIRNKR